MTIGGGTSTIHPLSKLQSGVAFGRVLLVPVVLIGVPVENGDFVDACLKKQCGDLFLLSGRECAFLMQNTVVGGADKGRVSSASDTPLFCRGCCRKDC